MSFAAGDAIRVLGHPSRYSWMEEFIGKEGTVEEVLQVGDLTVVRFAVPGAFEGESHFLSSSYVEKVEGQQEGAA